MIVHLAEVWVVLVVAFVAGCGGGALLFGYFARGRFANAQLAMADAVGRVEDFGRERLGMAPLWRRPRSPALPTSMRPKDEDPDPMWEVIDRAVEAVRADTGVIAPPSGTRVPHAPRIADRRTIKTAETDQADDNLDGLLWEVPDLPDEIAGTAEDAPAVGPLLNGAAMSHDVAADETPDAIDLDAVNGTDAIAAVDGSPSPQASDDDRDAPAAEQDGANWPVFRSVRRRVPPQPARVAPPPPPIPARQPLAARNAWRQSRVPLLTAPAGNVQNEDTTEIRKPATLPEPRNGVPDNLTRIRGIGERNEVRLNNLGIFHFSQIAAWTPAEIAWISQRLAFPERIQHDDWVGQAIVLASGGQTGFTKASERRRARRRNGREGLDGQADLPEES